MKRLPIILLASITVVACFERPVDERVEIEIGEEGETVVKTSVTLHEKGDEKKRLVSRLDRLRESLLNERDDWSRRYGSVAWEEDRVELTRVQGTLQRVTRTGTTSRDQLHRFFNDFAIINFTRGEGWEELTISPLAARRATAKQRDEVEKKLDRSAAAIADYLRDVALLYDYLRLHPDRSHDTFAQLLRDVVDDETRSGELTDEEQRLVDPIYGHFRKLASILEPEDDAEYSIDELSLLAYDPFPADMTLRLPARVITSDGFEKTEAAAVTIRRASLWEATEELQSSWISPDPVKLWVEAWRDPKHTKIDLADVVATPRRVEMKQGNEIRNAIVNSLRPQARYSVRWEDR